MNVLEKILEEIEEKIKMKKAVWESLEKPPYNDFEQNLWIEGMKNAKEIIRSYMNEAMDTNVHSKWIPVTDHLPQEKGWYQCSCCDSKIWSDGLVRDLYFCPETKEFVDRIRYSCNGLKDIEKYYWTKYVVAWQPLPEQYKGE